MEHKFTLSFPFNGKQYDLNAMFMRLGYVHQFHVNIEEKTLIIEFDEERNYRVIDSNAGMSIASPYNEPDFLQALVSKVSSYH